MNDWIILLFSSLLLLLVFLRRYYLLEKGHLFGKMVLKKGFGLPSRLNKEDHEVTTKEMIPDAATINPKLALKGESFFRKAELELKKGHLGEAERLYIKAISMNPAQIEAHAKLGTIYLNQEQYAKAELIFRKLVLAKGDEAVYFSNLGLCLFQQEKYAEAKDFYEKAIELDPSRAGRFYSLARINHLLGDMKEAFSNIEKALNMDADNINYGLTLGHWYMEKGMISEARNLLETILKHWPDNEEAKEMIKSLGVN